MAIQKLKKNLKSGVVYMHSIVKNLTQNLISGEVSDVELATPAQNEVPW